MHIRHVLPHQRTCTNGLDQPSHVYLAHIGTLFMPILSNTHIYQGIMHLQPLSDCIHFIYQLALCMPHNTGLLHMNIPYGMLQSQHYSSGQQILEPHILSNVIDCMSTQLSSMVTTHNRCGVYQKRPLFSNFVTTLNYAFETELAKEDKGYESGSESFNIPTPLSRALRIYHVSTREELSFNPCKLWTITNHTRAL